MATKSPGVPLTVSPFHAKKRPPITGASKIKLNRRWSLDNLSEGFDTKEGYVKDLRKQHLVGLSSIKDEEYPCMLTEMNRTKSGNVSPMSGCSSSASTPKHHGNMFSPKINMSRMMLGQRNRSGSVELGNFSRNTYRHRTVSKSPFSSSVDISVVPEDNEISIEPSSTSPIRGQIRAVSQVRSMSPPRGPLETKSGKAFLRQRSSSLPRILPPILDDDDDAESLLADPDRLQTERNSTLVAREMQKFVCRQASDVSTLLPLPLLTNWRQSKSLSRKDQASHSSCPGDVAIPKGVTSRTPSTPASEQLRKQYLLLMGSLAKIHGIFYSIRQSAPSLFQDLGRTLKLDEDRRLGASPLLEPILKGLKREQLLRETDEARVRMQIQSLTSISALPFCVITHGGHLDLRQTTFKTDNVTLKTSAMKLPGFNAHSCLGSPLLDIFAIIIGSLDCDEIFEEADLSLTDFITELLQEYHSTLTRTTFFLRCNTFNLTLKELCHDMCTFLNAGVIVSLINRPNLSEKQPGLDPSLKAVKVLKTLRPSIEALT